MHESLHEKRFSECIEVLVEVMQWQFLNMILAALFWLNFGRRNRIIN